MLFLVSELRGKSKTIKFVLCLPLSQNTFLEKYQAIILFPWDLKRAADVIGRLGYSNGLMFWGWETSRIPRALLGNACTQAQGQTEGHQLLSASQKVRTRGQLVTLHRVCVCVCTHIYDDNL